MRDVLPMGFLQSFRDLAADRERFLQWQRACSCERLAWHQLHNQAMQAVGFLHTVDGCDVRMI